MGEGDNFFITKTKNNLHNYIFVFFHLFALQASIIFQCSPSLPSKPRSVMTSSSCKPTITILMGACTTITTILSDGSLN